MPITYKKSSKKSSKSNKKSSKKSNKSNKKSYVFDASKIHPASLTF